MFVVSLAVLGQPLAPGRTLQQAGAQARLESRKALAYSGARQVQPFGGFGQVAALDDLQKEFDTVKTWRGHGAVCRP